VVPFLAFLRCALLIQGATNMFNEYYDWRRGLDDAQSVGIAGAIVRDGVPPQLVWLMAWSTVAVAAALGVWLSDWTGSWLLWVGPLHLGRVGLRRRPLPVAYGPWGELVVAVFMGLVIVGVAYYLQAGKWSPKIWPDSVPVLPLGAAILMANNLRDYDQEQPRGRKTLAIRLGKPRGQ
jgi:1,4-dihydroxy-2-naphthoate octaprenyltransferase